MGKNSLVYHFLHLICLSLIHIDKISEVFALVVCVLRQHTLDGTKVTHFQRDVGYVKEGCHLRDISKIVSPLCRLV